MPCCFPMKESFLNLPTLTLKFAFDLATYSSRSRFSASYLLGCFFSMNDALAISSPIFNLSLIVFSFDDGFDDVLNFPDLFKCFNDLEICEFDAEFDFDHLCFLLSSYMFDA